MKVARRGRDGRRESNKQQIFVISPSVIFDKMTAPSSEGAGFSSDLKVYAS